LPESQRRNDAFDIAGRAVTQRGQNELAASLFRENPSINTR
jgi:hypothetical protein